MPDEPSRGATPTAGAGAAASSVLPSMGRAADPRASVSALLIVRNGRRWLAECLDGIAAQTVPPDRLLIVDVASTDTTVAMAQAHSGVRQAIPEVTILRIDDPVPIGRAIDLGVEHLGAPSRPAREHDPPEWLRFRRGPVPRVALGAARQLEAVPVDAGAPARCSPEVIVGRCRGSQDRRLGRPTPARLARRPGDAGRSPDRLAGARRGRPGPARPADGRPRREHERHAPAPRRPHGPPRLRSVVRAGGGRSRSGVARTARGIPGHRRAAGDPSRVVRG